MSKLVSGRIFLVREKTGVCWVVLDRGKRLRSRESVPEAGESPDSLCQPTYVWGW